MPKNYKPYNQCSKNVDSPSVEETVETPVTEEIKETTVETTSETESKIVIVGTVKDCARLRVRKSPRIIGSTICEIPAGSKVVIEDDSDDIFYKVVTQTGIEGYCMKRFITIEQ